MVSGFFCKLTAKAEEGAAATQEYLNAEEVCALFPTAAHLCALVHGMQVRQKLDASCRNTKV